MKKNWMVVVLSCGAGFALAGVPEGLEAYGKFRYPEARKELAEPAAAGDVEAMAAMGEMLVRGQGGSRDELKAREYIVKAQEGGSLRATHMLGTLYLNGNLVAKDETKGVDLVKKAAEQGYPPSQALYGVWLSRGQYGHEKNEPLAMTWFTQAAAQNDPLAMNWMGDAAEYGKAGIAQDYLVALDWYKKSGERQNTGSMISAGRIYALGRGVAADGNEALRWFKRALVLGNLNAYIWIGAVYEFGRGGVTKSPSLAYAWYAALPTGAAPDLVKPATESKERVGKTLSATEVEDALKVSKNLLSQAQVGELVAAASRPSAAPISKKGVSGSGVLVSRRGDVLTNEHVIQGCDKVRVQPSGLDAKVIAKDSKNDLALLKMEGHVSVPVRLRTGKGIRLGDELVAIGYPLRGLLSSGPIVTTGIVNALSGVNDDTSGFQMSATVQPGSSGGPIVDNSGALVGLVKARLLPSGPIAAQNVNFGINLATVSSFLDAHAVEVSTQAINTKGISIADVAAQVQKSTVGVECY